MILWGEFLNLILNIYKKITFFEKKTQIKSYFQNI